MTAEDRVRTYWDAADRRDWAAFGGLLAADVVYRIPQSGEQITGRDRYLMFNRDYPGDWSITVDRVVSQGDEAVSWISFVVDSRLQTAVTFFRLDPDGRFIEIVDFWPEPYDAPSRPAGVIDT